MNYQTLKAKPFSGALGAEITGVDLSLPLENHTFNDVHKALLDHQVIIFRDQKLTPKQQLTFAKRFGGIHQHPYISGLPRSNADREGSERHTYFWRSVAH